jgi:hypothetical protein
MQEARELRHLAGPANLPTKKLSLRRSAWMVAVTMMLSSLAGSTSSEVARYATYGQGHRGEREGLINTRRGCSKRTFEY